MEMRGPSCRLRSCQCIRGQTSETNQVGSMTPFSIHVPSCSWLHSAVGSHCIHGDHLPYHRGTRRSCADGSLFQRVLEQAMSRLGSTTGPRAAMSRLGYATGPRASTMELPHTNPIAEHDSTANSLSCGANITFSQSFIQPGYPNR
eukprot:239951-Pelagomonas_calceolata.AAC.3